MKNIVTGLILLSLLQSSISNAAGLCLNLFNSKSETAQAQVQSPQSYNQKIEYAQLNSSRVEVTKVSDDNSNSRVQVEQMEFSKDPEQAVIELIRFLVNGRTFALEDKNVLIKNKMTLGIPLKDGYTFLVTYESKSTNSPLFVIEDKIVLLSPTNKEYKLTDGLLSPTQMKIAKSDFDMPEYFDKDLLVNLKIPLTIDATVLAKLGGYAKYFEHIPKEKLRKIFAEQSSVKRKMLLQIGRAKSMFNTAFLKSPFKVAAQALFMAVIFNGTGHVISNYINNPLPPLTATQISNMHLNKTATEQMVDIRGRANHRAMATRKKELSSIDQVTEGATSLVANNEVTWVLETKDEDAEPHTYIAFSGELTRSEANQNAPLQYVIMEIDPVKYAKLIAQIKENQKPLEGR